MKYKFIGRVSPDLYSQNNSKDHLLDLRAIR